MKKTGTSSLDEFARRFVTIYWRTVKERTFPMPPDEPEEETLEELLAAVSIQLPSGHSDTIVMTSKHGDWWEFSFRHSGRTRYIASAKAKPLSPAHPHELLKPPFEHHFRPFLDHVTEQANKDRNETPSDHRHACDSGML